MALKQWAQRHGIELLHIQPGKPTQNAYIERFNRTFRTEVLDRYIFTTLTGVRHMSEDWQHRYNHDRPHRSLGGLSPIRYAMTSSSTYFRMTRKYEDASLPPGRKTDRVPIPKGSGRYDGMSESVQTP